MAQNDRPDVLRKRLLNDIAEVKQKPYPGIDLHVQDEDALTCACLILSPKGQNPLHLTIRFTKTYPLTPPKVKIQSRVAHPNVFNDYICASILNTEEGYTSAYTLKGICIQLLSFFSSDSLEQEEYGGVVNLNDWRQWRGHVMPVDTTGNPVQRSPGYECDKCGFGTDRIVAAQSIEQDIMTSNINQPYSTPKPYAKVYLVDIPAEVLCMVCDNLDEEELFLAARAWNGFGRLINRYNIIRNRELQCFTLKEGFNTAYLGIGVHTEGKTIQSEFDLLSDDAFVSLGVRRSAQGLDFEHWLPLPISQTHWDRVKPSLQDALQDIADSVGSRGPLLTVLYSFMNDIVVRLSREATEGNAVRGARFLNLYGEQKSTLTCVSEKAIENYFHLFHLLACLAIEDPNIAEEAKDMITNFMDGKRDKKHVPNLGHLLIMVLISGKDVTEELTKAIIAEAITRNVVWMLDAKGANLPELSFMETDVVSEYRLQKTFDAGKTSYRLLMFASMMNRHINTTTANGQVRTLQRLRNELFERKGAPPNGAATELANAVKRIQTVSNFPQFLTVMGIKEIPAKAPFTTFLRRTVYESVDKGYSKWGLSQQEALSLSIGPGREPGVGRAAAMQPSGFVRRRYTFFPK